MYSSPMCSALCGSTTLERVAAPSEDGPPMAPFLVCTIVESWCEFVRLHRRAGHAVHLYGRRCHVSEKEPFRRVQRHWGQAFKGGGSLAAHGEQHTGRTVASEGRSERYLGPSFHHPRQSECCRPTFVDELQSALISQQTFVAFMIGEGIEETSVEPVTTAVS